MHPWQIFVEGLKNWRKIWGKLSGIYLLIYIPLTIWDILSAFWIFKDARPGFMQIGGGVVRWVLEVLAVASLILAVKEQANMITSNVVGIIKTAVKYLWRYILTTLLYSLGIGGIALLIVIIMGMLVANEASGLTVTLLMITIAMIACVAAMVYCAVRFSLAGVVCIMENAGPIASLKTSYTFIKKHVSPVIGVYSLVLLFIIICYTPLFIFGSVIVPKSTTLILLTSYQVLVNAIIVPVGICVMVMLYKRLQEAGH